MLKFETEWKKLEWIREPGNGGVFVGGKEGESEGEVRGVWLPLW